MKFIIYSSAVLAWLAFVAFGAKTPVDYFLANAQPLAPLERADATSHPSKLLMQGFFLSGESYRLSNGKRSRTCFVLPQGLNEGQAVTAFLDIGVPQAAIGRPITVASAGKSVSAQCEQRRCDLAVPVWPMKDNDRLFCALIEMPVTEPVPAHMLQTGMIFYSLSYAISP